MARGAAAGGDEEEIDMKNDQQLYMVFDVESVGLHGEAFAVGWVVVRRDGSHVASAEYGCDPASARGDADDLAWVREHCQTQRNVPAENGPYWVRERFWEAWEYARKRGALLAADVAWPVEANFLSACIADKPEERKWCGPYPLVDISSVRLAAGFDPTKTEARHNGELPEHNPLADARQSSRLLLTALWVLDARLAAEAGEPA